MKFIKKLNEKKIDEEIKDINFKIYQKNNTIAIIKNEINYLIKQRDVLINKKEVKSD